MANVSNPDDDMMKKQQEADLGHPQDHPLPAHADGAVHAKIERLDASVDADGFLSSQYDATELDTANSEQARKRAIEKAKSQASQRR